MSFAALFVFVGSVIINLLDMTSLGASNQAREVQQHVNVIEQYERSGDYAKALIIARDCYEQSKKLGLNRNLEANFLKSVKRLEQELLTMGSSKLLFDENGQPRVKLLELLHLVGMEPLNKLEKPISQINSWAQANLLRKGERWEQQTNKFEELKTKVKPLLKELGFIDASSAHFDVYQGAIIHGALLSRVRLRFHYLVEQWEKGIRFSHLYFLGSERPLEGDQEIRELLIQDERSRLKVRKNWPIPTQLPKTECEMMQLIWEQSEIPETMRNEVTVHFINAPMTKDLKTGKLVRPTTDDTVKHWLKTSPPLGNYLAITNAPYTNRQDLVLRALTPGNYGFDTIGSAANKKEKVAIFLDELARYIFQIKQLSEVKFQFNNEAK